MFLFFSSVVERARLFPVDLGKHMLKTMETGLFPQVSAQVGAMDSNGPVIYMCRSERPLLPGSSGPDGGPLEDLGL